jgi:hypothetical protein
MSKSKRGLFGVFYNYPVAILYFALYGLNGSRKDPWMKPFDRMIPALLQ